MPQKSEWWVWCSQQASRNKLAGKRSHGYLEPMIAGARLFAVPAQYANGNGGNDAAAVASASKRETMMKQHILAMFY